MLTLATFTIQECQMKTDNNNHGDETRVLSPMRNLLIIKLVQLIENLLLLVLSVYILAVNCHLIFIPLSISSCSYNPSTASIRLSISVKT